MTQANPAGSSFGWAILGPGRIAAQFARAVQAMPLTHVDAVWGRRPDRVAAFVDELGLAKGTRSGDLDALLASQSVRGVYVATTHQAHADLVRKALTAGKAVVCEKPLTPSGRLTGELIDLSRDNRVFLMEALWTRFLPVYQGIGRWLKDGRIGHLKSVASSFCFPADYDPSNRLFDPGLAGGALLDIGIYNVAMTRWAIATANGSLSPVVSRSVLATHAPTGVDLSVSVQLGFADGTGAQFICALDRLADNALVLHGSHGVIRVPSDFWQAQRAVLNCPGQDEQWLTVPHSVNGFEYEIAEAMRCIERGDLESPLMPHQESLGIAQELDALRAAAGVRYPFD